MTKWGLLLAPGAGGSSESPALLATDAAMPASVTVRRMDFAYRLAGKKAPDRGPVLLQTFLDNAQAFSAETGIPLERIFIGGRSMGGRIASIAHAEGLATAGLVLISYPLHPPGRLDKLRIEHFPDITAPCLFVSGTRDAFGTEAELDHHTNAITTDVHHHWIEGGDHGLAKYDDVTSSVVKDWIQARVA